MCFFSQLHSWNCACFLFLFCLGFLPIYLEPFPHTFPFPESEFVPLVYFFNWLMFPFKDRLRSQRRCLLHLMWWKIEYTGFQILTYCVQFIYLFPLFGMFKHSFEIYFNWTCPLILDTEKLLFKIECLVWFKVSVESTSEFSLIFLSDLLCNSGILPTLSSICVNSWVLFTALTGTVKKLLCLLFVGQCSFRLQILFLSL